MKWKKLGKIFSVDDLNYYWMNSHAMMPVVEQIDENIFRIYFSPRDNRNRSRCASIDLDIFQMSLSNLSKVPILDLGDLGSFDDSGVMPTSIVSYEGKKYLYYNGWTLGKNIPFFSFNGVAISEDGGNSFKKLGRYPTALNRNEIDPFSTFAPFVIKEEDKWRMWYVSLVKWVKKEELTHFYNIKYAESDDGINWKREGVVAIDFADKYEYAIARPCVLYDKGIYKMWYSYRASRENKTYRIGYAESEKGISWVRKDKEAGINVSEDGWDSEMICYSFVFDHKCNRYMLYNGNGYGKTGIGLAVLEDD